MQQNHSRHQCWTWQLCRETKALVPRKAQPLLDGIHWYTWPVDSRRWNYRFFPWILHNSKGSCFAQEACPGKRSMPGKVQKCSERHTFQQSSCKSTKSVWQWALFGANSHITSYPQNCANQDFLSQITASGNDLGFCNHACFNLASFIDSVLHDLPWIFAIQLFGGAQGNNTLELTEVLGRPDISIILITVSH